MSARRLDGGGEIDRDRAIPFRFDGRAYSGFAGDTLASALLANGVRIVGRSFKYHRPRGIWGAWVEEPNALFDVTVGGRTTPNLRATTEWLREGMALASVNTAPDAEHDRLGVIDRLARFMPAGFYYKTFLWPEWRVFEPRIRAVAGLGRLDPQNTPGGECRQRNVACDLLVVGAGPAGLAAARLAAERGDEVILADDQPRPGGSLLHRGGVIDGEPGRDWAADCAARVEAAGGRHLARTTVYGAYDHRLACAWQRSPDGADMLWRIRAKKIVIAAGAIERPLVFPDNDRPGVMSAEAALLYLRRYGVLAGERIVIATNNDAPYAAAAAFAEAGGTVLIADSRAGSPAMRETSVEVRRETSVTGVLGRRGVEAVELDGARFEADCLLVSGGFTPTVHLFCQAGGKLRFDERLACFVPAARLPDLAVAGAANGAFSLAEALADGRAAVCSEEAAPRAIGGMDTLSIEPAWPEPGRAGRQWIDFQNDVTMKDVEIAAQENFRSVEHLKRYTTLGMATDQGKTSNLNGLAALAAVTSRTPAETGTTTYRPPYVPIPLNVIAGRRRGELFNPPRRLVLENEHRAAGAVLRDYGGWLRPAFYGAGTPEQEIQREAGQARETVALFDGSPLGKIEVFGPQAAALVDFSSYNTMSTLRPGRLRYGFMLTEAGHVYDDGVTARVAENHFILSCSSSHVPGVYLRLEEWRQERFDPAEVVIHNATAQWATLTASGPRAGALIAALGLDVVLDDAMLPHMGFAEGRFAGGPVRIARVSFTGDRSYEISVPASAAGALWARMREEGRRLDAVLMGVEALMILRAEKGYVVAGKDTDGTTMPHDLGLAGPRDRRQDEFVGRRSLFTEEAQRPDRRQLVGLKVADGEAPLPTGAHSVERHAGRMRSIGYVTSSYESPTLKAPIALGLIERGLEKMGEEIEFYHFGRRHSAVVADPCAFDRDGARLNG